MADDDRARSVEQSFCAPRSRSSRRRSAAPTRSPCCPSRRRSARPTPSRGASPATRSSCCRTSSHLHVVDDPTSGAGRLRGADGGALRARLERVPGNRGGGRPAGGAGERRVSRRGRRDRRRARQERRARARTRSPAPMSSPTSTKQPLDVIAPFDAANRRRRGARQGARQNAALAPRRLSEPFERLRDHSDASLAAERRATASVSRQSRPGRRLHRRAPISPRISSRRAG